MLLQMYLTRQSVLQYNSITDISSESNSLANVAYSKPHLALHLVIGKLIDLLADFATAFAIPL